MRMYDVIAKKRDGGELATEEIYEFIEGYVKGDIPDYQVSALLMAIYLNASQMIFVLILLMMAVIL